jgi:hypothetical protein
MMKPITGQYECVHSSGVGLDYFTSRIDRLVVQNNGRFVLTTQNHSRATDAARSFVKGQQAPTTASETRMEGTYSQQGPLLVLLQFDAAGSEQAHLAADGSALQIGPNYFTKVSDSTLLPPTHRLQQDMNDISKGLKLASTIGGMAVKASKMIKDTLQPVPGANNNPNQTVQPAAQPYTTPPQAPSPAYVPPASSVPPVQQPVPPVQQPAATQARSVNAIFCDQCGARSLPGKRFCNVCGARLP